MPGQKVESANPGKENELREAPREGNAQVPFLMKKLTAFVIIDLISRQDCHKYCVKIIKGQMRMWA